ncbi:hypothetical protein GCM10010512_17750 [Streptomyces thermoviolaceus subsp. thermoviolaceus]|nr:hypothetical protein GCM10010512_17750 [Streptomyces thermoviolaceus subsp. thermoviolaceus]
MGGAERTQQADAVLDGSVDQFEHLRDEFPHPGRGEVGVEVGTGLPAFVDDESAGRAFDFVGLVVDVAGVVA